MDSKELGEVEKCMGKSLENSEKKESMRDWEEIEKLTSNLKDALLAACELPDE